MSYFVSVLLKSIKYFLHWYLNSEFLESILFCNKINIDEPIDCDQDQESYSDYKFKQLSEITQTSPSVFEDYETQEE